MLIEKDNDIKAVVVKGAGEVAFCAGGNYNNLFHIILDHIVSFRSNQNRTLKSVNCH